jgi:predicted nucleic acid-binding protein
VKLFVDTWGWLAIEDRKDPRHLSALDAYRDRIAVKGRTLTSDYILAETYTFLFRKRPFEEAWRFMQAIHASIARESVSLQTVTPRRFLAAVELRRQLMDKPRISFTDLTSFVIMKELQVREVLTGDEHFRQAGLGFFLIPKPD